MYKSRLQELCQKKSWNIPTYSASKDGLDHNPRFKASVSVNGVSFETPIFFKSSKDAQNEAAKLAFDHFTSPQPLFLPKRPVTDASPPSSPGSSSASTELNNAPNSATSLLPKIQEKYQSSQIHLNSVVVKNDKEFGDMQYVHKSQLQNYAQRRNLNPPVYSRQLEGQPHVPHFKATVTVDGKTFESPEFFRTLREAEHAAAKAALMSLSLDDIQEDDSGFYKNLLQELAQKEGISLPIYHTIRSGPSHLPTFSSTVEIEGEFFHGKEAKTKKQAEINAAKVAYPDLKQRRLSQSHEFLFPVSEAEEAFEYTPPKSIITSDLQQNLQPKSPSVFISRIRSEEHSEESRDGDQEADSTEVISAKPDNDTARNRDTCPSSDKVYACLRDPFPSVPSSPEDGPSLPTMPSDCFARSVVDSNIEPSTGIRSTSQCNRVRVCPRIPDMEFPKGATVLPISDDKWVAMSFGSRNQEGLL